MLSLSKKVEYGLMALVHMASVSSREPISAKDLADAYALPAELLGKVLQTLTRVGLVSSSAGARGGYCLQKPLEKITLGDVIEALEGPVALARCCQDDPAQCGQFHACNIKAPIHQIHLQLLHYLHGISLSALQTAPNTQPRTMVV